MDFLVDPNVSYVLLVIGFLVAVLALFSPGTGILEIAALFTLALAGYGIANLPIQWWGLGIMLLGIFPFLYALRRPRRFRLPMLFLASLAFVLGSAFLFRGQGWRPAVNLWLVLLMAPLTIGLTWILATKTLEAVTSRPSFDLDLLVGMTGKATSDVRGLGTVYVNGEEWSARSTMFIPAGSPVRVLRRDGLQLEVEPLSS